MRGSEARVTREKGASKISTLKGIVDAVTSTENERWRIDAVGKNREWTTFIRVEQNVRVLSVVVLKKTILFNMK